MKKVLRILPLLLLVLSCGKPEKLPTDVSTFTLQVSKVTGTKVWFNITTDNPNAYYTFGLVDKTAGGYDMSPNEMAELQLAFMNDLYEAFAPMGENIGTFTDVYLYKGNREFKEKELEVNTEYKIFLMQVDPDTHKLIGNAQVGVFHTKPIEMVDMDFAVVFHPDGVEVIPSNEDLPYYWDYEETETIRDKYYHPKYFFYELVDMYEDYDFIQNLLDVGPAEWVFSRDDKSIQEGEQYTLVVAGYGKGEINTGYTIVDFIYHKNDPIEVLDVDWDGIYILN